LGVNDIRRYHRQMLLPGIGEEGQRRLLASHAVVVGCGALGCAIGDLLARAGVGTLTLIDRDVVEWTNLQRQTLFDERDAVEGMPKAEAARRRLAAVNSGITINAFVADVTAANAESLIAPPPGHSVTPSLLLDGTDNFETRYLLNDLAVKRGVPYVYGGAVGTHGMQMSILPGRTACLRCLFEEPPPAGTTVTCDTVGVLGPLISMVAASEAADAIKILAGLPDQVPAGLLDVDLWGNEVRRLAVGGPRAECPCCGRRQFEFLSGARAAGPASLCGQDAVQIAAPAGAERIDLEVLAARLAPHGPFKALGRFLVRGTLAHERGDGSRADGAPIELTVFADGRAIVKGTTRPEIARSIYARYVGG
jgi:adenylyltransferase/sulfurtransferase